MKFANFIGLTTSLLAACGGPAKAPDTARTDKASASPREESIADAAAAQGGLASLGGAGNREEGATGVEAPLGGPLHVDDVDPKMPVKFDGVLKEWPARVAGSQTISGDTEGLGLAVAVQADDTKLYVAAEITDRRLSRSGRHEAVDDHVSMILAFPSGRGGLKAYTVGFFPGKPGESSGAVKWIDGPRSGQEIAAAKIVESDTAGGMMFEAAVPWSTFAEARTMRVGLRAAFRYHDRDGTSSRGVLGLGAGSAEHPFELPALPTTAEQAVVTGLLGPQGLAGTAPKIDVFADVAGDERKERISVFGRFFTVCGPGYRSGKQFFWREIAGELTSLEARELTGRSKEDMIVRRRTTSSGVVREQLEVWSITSGDEPSTVFAQEISVADPATKRRISNAVRVSAKEIEVSAVPAVGWDASTFRIPSIEDGVLLPWGPVKSRVFRFERGKFVKASEVSQPGAVAARTPSPEMEASPRDVPTPPVRKSTDVSRQVMDQYFRDQNVAPGSKPRFDLEVHVDGDARPERVALVGRDIVVLGPGFRSGSGYARLSLTQFTDDKDVSELTARDVTGDGSAELIIRGVRHVKTPAGDTVEVGGLYIYQVKSGNIGRVFAVETGRELAGKRVQGLVQFIPSKGGKGFDVDVRPGVARGWDSKSYPWPQEKPGGSMEPLLLPWGGIPSLRYSWNGTQFVTP